MTTQPAREQIARLVETALGVFPEGMKNAEMTDGVSNLAWLTADAILALPASPDALRPSAPASVAGSDLLSGRYSKMLPIDQDRDRQWHAICVELLGIISEQNSSLKGAMPMMDALARATSAASEKLEALAAPASVAGSGE